MDLTLFETNIYDYALVAVVVAVKNQRPERRVHVARRRGDVADYFFEHGMDIDACLCRDLRRVLSRDSDYILDLADDPLRIGTGKIDLVDNGNDLKSAVNSKIGVCQGLSLDSLGRVNNKDRALAGCERT